MKATFFVVGCYAAEHPDIVRETLRRGHDIGTHLYHHRRETVRDLPLFEQELRRSCEVLESALGEPVRWLRYPYGNRGLTHPRTIQASFGLRTVHWTFSSHDSISPEPARIVRRVSAGLRPGVIILMHDRLADADGALPDRYVTNRSATIAALGPIADLLGERGVRAVTLTELLDGR